MADTEFLIESIDIKRRKCKICVCLTTKQGLVLSCVLLGICIVVGVSLAVVFGLQARKECEWSDWTELRRSTCTKDCGTGQLEVTYTRKATGNVEHCSVKEGSKTDKVRCNTFPCPVCGWSEWTVVSKTACSEPCGTGHQIVNSTRKAIKNLAYCPSENENSTTTKQCNTFKCPECEWSEWTVVSKSTCSKSCGTGHQTVTSTRKAIKNLAYCLSDNENSTTLGPCNTFKCPVCGWSKWTIVSKTACSEPCGTGHRTVNSTRKAIKNLAYCPSNHENSTTTKQCNTFKCPECRSNAKLTHWSDTSHCARKGITKDWTQTTTNSMNPLSAPCYDFYSYACGGWDRRTSIPNGYDTYSKFQELMVTTYCDIKDHLQTNPESDAERKAFSFYQTCSSYGRQYRQDTINRLKSDIRSFSGNTLSSLYHSAPSINILKKIHKLGAWAIFEAQRRTSPVDKSRQTLSISVGSNPFAMENEFSINLPDEQMEEGLPSDIIEKLPMVQSSMKLSEDGASSIISLHKTVNKLIFKIFWDVDIGSSSPYNDQFETYSYNSYERTATKMTNDLLDFEFDLLEAMVPGKSADNYGEKKDFKFISVEELQDRCFMISWENYFADIPVTNGYHIDGVLVLEPDVFFRVCEVVARANHKVLQSYLLVTYIKSMLPYFGILNLLADDTVYTSELQSKDEAKRWFTCMEHTELAFGKVFGSVYVRNMGINDDIDKVRTILKYVKNAYTDHILQAPWIDSTTRNAALTKIKYMLDKIGYPDSILDTSLLDQEYRTLPVCSGSWVDTVIAWKKFSFIQSMKPLSLPTDRNIWGLSPATINAVHELTVNDITIPSAIFRLPFFDAKRPMAMNFGGIGAVIGHEITHAFGEAGKLFNEYGQMSDWMKKTTEEELVTKSKCFVDQYKYLDYKFKSVNGNKTLDENIADNGGIRAAFYAYRAWDKNQKADENLDEQAQHWVRASKLTGNQLFFLSYSQIYCSKWTSDGMKEISDMNHSPGPLRVKGPLMNTEFFQKSYSCPRVSAYVASHRCQLW